MLTRLAVLVGLSAVSPLAAQGACCTGGGIGGSPNCLIAADVDACALTGGVYRGDGSTCDDGCDDLLGPCCIDLGTCIDGVLEPDCVGIQGAFGGSGARCDDSGFNCAPIFGACCLSGTQCVGLFFGTCLINSGEFLGSGVDCDDVDCGDHVGACCAGEVCLTGVLEPLCSAQGGVFLGMLTSCDAFACEDCNTNDIPDAIDISQGLVPDVNLDGRPDPCQDCDNDGVLDDDALLQGISQDCNGNGLPDNCDVDEGRSRDLDLDYVPDECEDCNVNFFPDSLDISTGVSLDENNDGLPDECAGCPDPIVLGLEDFRGGFGINLARDGEGELVVPLTRNELPVPMPYITVAASVRNTIVRLDTRTGEVVGEYASKPFGRSGNPSRTTVDLDGRVWACNRGESENGQGSAVQIGLIVGGTRVNGDGTPNPIGDYLAPPFLYNSCVDRDDDGLIATSRGIGDIRPWTNDNGVDNAGGVTTAQDECITAYTRVSSSGTRHISLFPTNDVWIGGVSGTAFELVDDDTGQILERFDVELRFGYGGVGDYRGRLWSVDNAAGNSILRYDTNLTPSTDDDTFEIIPNATSYGLGIDRDGNIWNSMWQANSMQSFTPEGEARFPEAVSSGGASGDRGVCVTLEDNHVWIANSSGNTVTRMSQGGEILKIIDLGLDGQVPTGVAVDARGKVWVTCSASNTVKRIDPDAGTDGLGAVDLTISLGEGSGPYNYSDMTGYVGLQVTGTATWHGVMDGGVFGAEWSRLSWNETCLGVPEPAGTRLAISVRAADREAALPARAWVPVSNGDSFEGVSGRFVQIRARLFGTALNEAFRTPMLCDMALEADPAPCAMCGCADPGLCIVDLDCNGHVDASDFFTVIAGFGSAGAPGGSVTGDANCDGVVEATDFFLVIQHFGRSSCPGVEPAFTPEL